MPSSLWLTTLYLKKILLFYTFSFFEFSRKKMKIPSKCEFSRLKKSDTYFKYFWCENSNILIGFKIQTFQNYIIKSYVSPDFFWWHFPNARWDWQVFHQNKKSPQSSFLKVRPRLAADVVKFTKNAQKKLWSVGTTKLNFMMESTRYLICRILHKSPNGILKGMDGWLIGISQHT